MGDITATQWLRMSIREREEFVAESGLPDVTGTQWLSIEKRTEYEYEPLPESLDVAVVRHQELLQELRRVFILIDRPIIRAKVGFEQRVVCTLLARGYSAEEIHWSRDNDDYLPLAYLQRLENEAAQLRAQVASPADHA